MPQYSDPPVLLVTGGGRGIGAAIAKAAGVRGYKVAINYGHSESAALAVASEVRALGGIARAFHADIGDSDSVVALFAEVSKELGPIVALVNNAGIDGSRKAIQQFDSEELRHLFEVNVIGMMICCREAAQRMSTQHGGRGGAIVNVSSMAVTIGGREGNAAYAASKAAVDVFTVGLAKELAPQGIRVNSVRPGMTATEMSRDVITNPDQFAEITKTIPMNRFAKPEEIALPVLWLLSEEASFITGARVDISGGGFVIR